MRALALLCVFGLWLAPAQAAGPWGRDSNYNLAISSGSSGALSGTLTNTGAGPTAINMTTLTSGGTDYTTYGLGSFPATCNKVGGGNVIGLLAVSGSGGSNGPDAQSWTWSFTDGQNQPASGFGGCTTTETSQTGGFFFGGAAAYGFTFTAPAGLSTQHLTVYAAAQTETLAFTATLSDASAGPFTNSACVNSGAFVGCKYVLTYNAASNGQTLTIKGVTVGTGFIGIDAATLTP